MPRAPAPQMPPVLLPRLMKRPAAAAYLGVSATMLDELGIKPRRVEGRRLALYDRLDLDAWADSLSDGEADNPWDAG